MTTNNEPVFHGYDARFTTEPFTVANDRTQQLGLLETIECAIWRVELGQMAWGKNHLELTRLRCNVLYQFYFPFSTCSILRAASRFGRCWKGFHRQWMFLIGTPIGDLATAIVALPTSRDLATPQHDVATSPAISGLAYLMIVKCSQAYLLFSSTGHYSGHKSPVAILISIVKCSQAYLWSSSPGHYSGHKHLVATLIRIVKCSQATSISHPHQDSEGHKYFCGHPFLNSGVFMSISLLRPCISSPPKPYIFHEPHLSRHPRTYRPPPFAFPPRNHTRVFSAQRQM
ncbi:hypothetical protein J6590_001656 [Homalodisca vitripennis]|nr:hypothetical protein J6590_001656 [Homalodisca vitripennis]